MTKFEEKRRKSSKRREILMPALSLEIYTKKVLNYNREAIMYF
jgi:hypothetical protein